MNLLLSRYALLSVTLIAFCIAVESTQAQDMYHSRVESVSISPELAEVKGLVDQFSRMWETQDLEMFDQLIADDPNIVVLGTDQAEFIIGIEEYRELRQRQFDSFNNVEHTVQEQTIRLSQSGDVAWFTTIYDMFLIDASEQPLSFEGIRSSGVLERRDEGWRIVHLHTSLPVDGQAAEY